MVVSEGQIFPAVSGRSAGPGNFPLVPVHQQQKDGSARGRPRTLTGRTLRTFTRTLRALREANKNVSLSSVVLSLPSLANAASLRSFYRAAHREGFAWSHVLRKGVLLEGDRKQRIAFAKEKLLQGPDFFTKAVCFYFDCASFLYKRNPLDDARTPRGRVWMQKGERLRLSGKAKNIGVGGKLLHLAVAISFGRGVVFCRPHEKLTGAVFADIVKTEFPPCAFNVQKLFLMDNDPAQNSKVALTA